MRQKYCEENLAYEHEGIREQDKDNAGEDEDEDEDEDANSDEYADADAEARADLVADAASMRVAISENGASNQEDGDDYEDGTEDDNDDAEEDGDEVDDDDDEEEQDEDGNDVIVDPGQHCQLYSSAPSTSLMVDDGVQMDPNQQHHHQIHQQMQHQQHGQQQFANQNDPSFSMDHDQDPRSDSLSAIEGERMLEVTRKLVRSTERDPDRDLRKQVLLKTAIKKLPHFVEYNRYTDSLEQGFHNQIMQTEQNHLHHHTLSQHQQLHQSPHHCYEHPDSQRSFYNHHSVQPNAIQMSTTGLRMLDLNDDPDLGTIEQDKIQDQNHQIDYNNDRSSLESHDYIEQQQQQQQQLHQQQLHHDRYTQRMHDLTNHFETTNPPLSRHNSLDNLYQPMTNGDIIDDITKGDGDERLQIPFQITCEIYDFTCSPEVDDVVDRCDPSDASDQSSSSSCSSTSSSEDSANSTTAPQSIEPDVTNNASLLEASLNTSGDFYQSSHDSGVALFSPRSNKRSSSCIGLDDEMEIEHLTELSVRSPSFGSNNQFKKLRKREVIE